MSASILVAEDDVFIRMVIADFLRSSGYNVIEAQSADDAMAIFQSGATIDLLFTDVRMPGSMDGRDLAKIVRDKWPNTRIIITSGYSSGLLGDKEAPDQIIMPKPYRPHQVLITIQSLVAAPPP